MAKLEVALALGMPVYRLDNEMPYEEFIMWLSYFELKPLGWRDDLRAGYQLKAAGVKEELHKIFPSLEPILKPKTSGAAFVKSTMFNRLLGAVGGDPIPRIEGM